MARVSRPTSPTGAPAPVVLPVDTHGTLTDDHAARAGTEDRGSFTHGTCSDCGWSGPGRRARAVAARDAVRHLQTVCAGSAPTPAAHRQAQR
jgi:hypothetical protein